MTFYWVLYGIPIIWGLLPETEASIRRAGGLFLAVIFIIAVGLRNRVGCDWDSYLEHLWIITTLPLNETLKRYDLAHGLVNWTASQLGFGIYAINLLYGVLFAMGLFRFVSRQPLPWLALACAVPYLVSVVAMGYTRQAVALGFIMLAYLAFADRKPWLFAFYVIAGATFHKTAAVFLPFVMLVSGQLHTRLSLVVFLVALIAIGGATLSASVDTYTRVYVQDTSHQSTGGLVRSLVSLVATLAFLMFWRRYKKLYRDFDFLLYCSIASLISVPLVLVASTAVDRLGLFLLPFQIAVVSRLPDVFEKSSYRTPIILGVLGAYTLQFYTWLNYSPMARQCWLPYRNYLWD